MIAGTQIVMAKDHLENLSKAIILNGTNDICDEEFFNSS